MNYSDYYRKTSVQICKEASRRGIPLYFNGREKDRNDLIGEIIAHDAYYEGRDDAMKSRAPKLPPRYDTPTQPQDNRINYRLQEEDCDPVYLRLTQEQANFATWCLEHEINFYCASLDRIDSIKWETP